MKLIKRIFNKMNATEKLAFDLKGDLNEFLKNSSITITECRTRRKGGFQLSIVPSGNHPIGGIDVNEDGSVRLWDVLIHRTADGEDIKYENFELSRSGLLKYALKKINTHWESAHGKYKENEDGI